MTYDLATRSPRRVLALVLLLTVVFGFFAARAERHFEMEDFFPSDGAQRQALEDGWARFGRDDTDALLLVRSDEAMGLEAFTHLAEASAESAAIEGVVEVLSPSSFTLIETDAAGTPHEREAFVPGQDGAERLSEVLQALSRPPHRDVLLSQNHRVAAIVVRLGSESVDQATRERVLESLEGVAEGLEGMGYRCAVGGYPMQRAMLARSMSSDARSVYPLALLVIGGALALLFRSAIGVFLPVLVGVTGVVWTLGLMSLLELRLSLLSPAVMVIVLLVAISDCLHLMSRTGVLTPSLGQREAVSRACREVGPPCLLASLTTTIVFASLALSGYPIARDFGLGVGLGVCVVFVLTFAVMPTLLVRFSVPAQPRGWSRFALRVCVWAQSHARAVVAVGALFVALGVAAALNTSVDSRLLADVDADHPARQALTLVEEELGGLVSVDLVLTPAPGEDPNLALGAERMARVGTLTQELRDLEGVRSVIGPLDPLTPLVELGPAGSVAEDLVGPGLLLGGERLRRWIDSRDGTVRIEMRVENAGSTVSQGLFERIQSVAKESLREGEGAKLGGQGYLATQVNAQMVETFAASFVAGTLLVIALFWLAFTGWRALLFGLAPNLIPLAAVAVALWASGQPFQYSSALVVCVVFGLVIDDTIHVLSHIRMSTGAERRTLRALHRCGPGILFTSVVIVAGFSALLGSELIANRMLGGLLALAAASAWVGDMVVLPAAFKLAGDAPRGGHRAALTTEMIAVQDLREVEHQQMYALFERYYERTSYAVFERDLSQKDSVIVMRERGSDQIRGFSTLVVYKEQLRGRTISLVYSGDTVLDHRFWGGGQLQRAFGRAMAGLLLRYPGRPVYWLLTSKGYKTYLLMRRNLTLSWPAFNTAMPDDIRELRDRSAARKFGERYNAAKSTLSAHGEGDVVAGGVAEVSETDLQDADIRYFVEHNPTYADGDELVCLAAFRWVDVAWVIARSVTRPWRRRRQRR